MKVVKIALKTHEIAPFLKIFLGGMPPNPLSKASQLRVMYIQNHRNFKVTPPPPLRNPAYAPVVAMTLIK